MLRAIHNPLPRMKLRHIYYASSLVLIYGVHLNATVVAFMKASPVQPLPSTEAWHWALRVLAFPLEWVVSPDSLQNVIVAAIFNSALWAFALTHLGRWLLRRRARPAEKPETLEP